ncbi:hypothetical protein [Mycetohabitans sp. B46]|uniref:hypothetical protein n=1 Tax=Mycetohabitans sp. B46 TaxID=2772536 RepID=UPI00307F9EEF
MFAALLAALTPTRGFATDVALATVAGVFSGSMLWWSMLVAVASVTRHGLDARRRRLIDWMVGLARVLFGVTEPQRAL